MAKVTQTVPVSVSFNLELSGIEAAFVCGALGKIRTEKVFEKAGIVNPTKGDSIYSQLHDALCRAGLSEVYIDLANAMEV